MGYQYLLFDADNTLFDFDAAERAAHATLCQLHGLDLSPESYAMYHRCNAELWHDYDRGLCTKDFLLIERFRRYLALLGKEGDPEALHRDYSRFLGESTILLPGALELCETLYPNHEMYILTNAVASVQKARFARSEISRFFKDFFISETIGVGKPNPAYYEYVFNAVPGLRKDNCLVIGDSLSSDMQGANNAGLPCCWYNPKGLPRPEGMRIDYEVRTLEEIPAIVL